MLTVNLVHDTLTNELLNSTLVSVVLIILIVPFTNTL